MTTHQKIELLAPGGSTDSIKAAIIAGADAIYCGLDNFNARKRAANISMENLHGILRLAHKHDCQIFLTLNIIILENELPALFKLLNQLANTSIDGVIVQDIGLFYLLQKYYPTLDVHASTQVTTHNEGQIEFLSELGASRVNLSRELNINEINQLTQFGHTKNILSEVFVHGSNCIGFSGLCYFSSTHGGNSGNRGQCSQPCRDQYQTTEAGKEFPLNLKDNSAFSDLPALIDAGVDSLKVEGRIKKFHYVHTVISSWRQQIDDFIKQEQFDQNNPELKENLRKVFNRDFSNAFLNGQISKDMYINNPRDNSVQYFAANKDLSSRNENEFQEVKQKLYDTKTDIIDTVNQQIKNLSIDKTELSITIVGELDQTLSVTVTCTDSSFTVLSETKLIAADKYTIDQSSIEKRLKSLDNAQFSLAGMDFSLLQADLFIPFKQLTTIKNRIVTLLNDGRETIAPVNKPKFKRPEPFTDKPRLAVLISCEQDIEPCSSTSADLYYQLPDCMSSVTTKLIALFKKNQNIIPWFPSIIIGDDYSAAVDFLNKVKPLQIVTNNTGIAYQAYKMNINWIAGPYLNITNSFSLLCMHEKFNCNGSFISNEISRKQIKPIVRPENFRLFYSIYHPILLLTSRQCLFHQAIGCKKEFIDRKCLPMCKRTASIINLKDTSFSIEKQRAEYNSMYNSVNYLNTDILDDIPKMFSDILIDLRSINSDTQIQQDKAELLEAFVNIINGKADAKANINHTIHPTTSTQYQKGL